MNYPAWLGAGLLNGFNWSLGVASTMPRFLDEYTLHDSNWIGLWSEPGFESVALIAWDSHWSGGRVVTPNDRPFLLIQFERLWRAHVSFPDGHGVSVIGGADSHIVGSEEKLSLIAALRGDQERRGTIKYLEEETLFHTDVAAILGGDVELWHGGATRFLCLDGSGQALPIPHL